MTLWGYGIQFPKRTKSTRPGKVSTTGVNVYQCSGSSIGGGEREREFSDNGHHLFIEFVPAGAIIDACINPLRTCVCVREREREREREKERVCVCVRERERESARAPRPAGSLQCWPRCGSARTPSHFPPPLTLSLLAVLPEPQYP